MASAFRGARTTEQEVSISSLTLAFLPLPQGVMRFLLCLHQAMQAQEVVLQLEEALALPLGARVRWRKMKEGIKSVHVDSGSPGALRTRIHSLKDFMR